MNAIPNLEHSCESWIITRISTGESVLETFQRSVAEKVNQEKYRVETAMQYLSRINNEIKRKQS